MNSPDLRQLALSRGDHVVAIGADGVMTADDLAERVGALAAALESRSEQRWGIWYEDSIGFMCAFLGLALAGKSLVMPHNMQTGNAAELSRHMDAMLTDGFVEGLLVEQFSEDALACKDGTTNGNRQTAVENDGQVSLTLFTSGTTGQPQAIAKTLALLEAELAVLQQAFGAQVATMPVVATVSHQHIYGLLHKLLWPLYRGAAIIGRDCQYPEELAELAGRHGPVVLVSSPTHLSRLPEAEAFCHSAEQVALMISSGGLLQSDAATALRKVCPAPVLEVLGSTETGGVAWRNQADSGQWQALPQVRVSADPNTGCLAVNSPHLGTEQAFVMGDRVRFSPDGSFSLAGRADTVVKVEGKRLSLTEMEHRLSEHPMVDQVRLGVLNGKRDEVGAVLVLAASGERLLAEGKHKLNQILRAHLGAFFERPLLPRRWRYVSALPLNAQGKVLAADIVALLKKPESGPVDVSMERPAQSSASRCDPFLPAVKVISQSEHNITLELPLTADMACFEGHFEGLPVLAGVVQVDWAVKLARQYLNLRGEFAGLSSVKFQKLVRPPANLQLGLDYQPDRQSIKFTYLHVRYGRCSAGVVLLGPQP